MIKPSFFFFAFFLTAITRSNKKGTTGISHALP
jgi:hypothetical protein